MIPLIEILSLTRAKTLNASPCFHLYSSFFFMVFTQKVMLSVYKQNFLYEKYNRIRWFHIGISLRYSISSILSLLKVINEVTRTSGVESWAMHECTLVFPGTINSNTIYKCPSHASPVCVHPSSMCAQLVFLDLSSS